MKRLPILIALLAMMIAAAGCTIQYYDSPDSYTDEPDDEVYYDEYYDDDTGFSDFDELKFWGQWIELSPYGVVWRPTVVMGWRPFDYGHWLWTEWGWTWVSYEPFGWATYHYGYWAYDFVYGWVWIPDYTWTPACVDWVIYDDYIAWAPRPAPGFRIGEPWYVNEVYVWHVVPAGDFTRPDIGRYHVGYKQNYQVKARSTVKYKAPQVDYVERSTNSVVKPVEVSLFDRFTKGDRSIKQMRLPDTEVKRVDRYRERVEQKIRDTNPPDVRQERGREPVQDDRIVPERKDRDTQPERREPPTRKKEATKKEPTKKGRDKPVKQDPDPPKAKKPDAPQKQEPEKKDTNTEPKKDPGKRTPKKKKG